MPTDTALSPRRRRSAPTAQQALANAKSVTKRTKVGRPLTYSPALCDQAIALGMKGKHWAAIARQFNVDRATLTKWASEFPEFCNALNRARAASQAWWESKIQSKLGAKHFQANAARLVMSGQFKEDYAEMKQTALGVVDLGVLVREALERSQPKTIEGASSFADPPKDEKREG